MTDADGMIALKTCARNSRYLLRSRYDADAPMSRATFNRVTYSVVELAKKEGLPLEPFTVHDSEGRDPRFSMNGVLTATVSRSAFARGRPSLTRSMKFSAAISCRRVGYHELIADEMKQLAGRFIEIDWRTRRPLSISPKIEQRRGQYLTAFGIGFEIALPTTPSSVKRSMRMIGKWVMAPTCATAGRSACR